MNECSERNTNKFEIRQVVTKITRKVNFHYENAHNGKRKRNPKLKLCRGHTRKHALTHTYLCTCAWPKRYDELLMTLNNHE